MFVEALAGGGLVPVLKARPVAELRSWCYRTLFAQAYPAHEIIQGDRHLLENNGLALKENAGVELLLLRQMEEALRWNILACLDREQARPDEPLPRRDVPGRRDAAQAELESDMRSGGHLLAHAEGDKLQAIDRRAGWRPQQAVHGGLFADPQGAGQSRAEQPGAIEEEQQAFPRKLRLVAREATQFLVGEAERRSQAQQTHARGFLKGNVQGRPGRLGGRGKPCEQKILDGPGEFVEEARQFVAIGGGQVHGCSPSLVCRARSN